MLIAILLLRKHEKWRTALTVAVLLLLWLGGNRMVAITLARSLEWRHLPQGELPDAPVIVVLGGSTESALPPRTQVEVNSAADRVLYAAALYHQGKAPVLLLSGGNIDWQQPGDESPATDMAELFVKLGVPQEDLWLEEQSLNTYENALYSGQMLKEHGIDHILLVTSAMHMPRALALFEAQGLDVTPAPADFTVTEEGWKNLFSGPVESRLIALLPNASSLALTTNVLKEYIGMAVYSLRGWM